MTLTQLTAVLTLVALTSSSIVKPPSDDGKNFELLILHNNDMHARFEQTSQLSGACTTADREAGKCYGGFPRVASVVKEARRKAASGEGPPVLYLNAGDTYTGTAWFTIYKWKIAAEFVNALEPDAVSLGNHEFDNGISGLTPFITNLKCPVLSANIILSKVPDLENEKNLMKSVVFNINNTRVGVIGYLTPETKVLAIRNDVEYIDEIIAVRQEVKRLKAEGVNILIALGHSGFIKDKEIAKSVEGIDLVIGGHTNTFLWNGTAPDSEIPEGPYPAYVKQASGRLVPVVQAYAYTKYLGNLLITFNSHGEILNITGNPILLNNSIPQDPDVLAIVHKYQKDVNEISEVVVGRSSVHLDGQSCRLSECNMGNLITDAIVAKYSLEYSGEFWTDAPTAILQGGGIRSSITKGSKRYNVTIGDLYTVMPFDGYIVKVTINGSTIVKMLEHSVANYRAIGPAGKFLQMSGLRVIYDLSKPAGKMVKNIEILCGKCDIPLYSNLNMTKEYNILMNGFMSMGGDGFSMFNDLPTTILPYNDFQCTLEYFNKNSPVHSALEDRIIFMNSLMNNGITTKVSVTVTILCFLSSILV